jgi:hypothetical protein
MLIASALVSPAAHASTVSCTGAAAALGSLDYPDGETSNVTVRPAPAHCGPFLAPCSSCFVTVDISIHGTGYVDVEVTGPGFKEYCSGYPYLPKQGSCSSSGARALIPATDALRVDCDALGVAAGVTFSCSLTSV